MDDVGLTATRAEGSDLSSSAPALIGGSKIGRYVILHVLGEGAMGQVYAAYDVQLDRKVAIKVLRADLVSTSVRERTLREAKALAKLSHPNVVQVYEVGDHHEQLFLVLEYVRGANLRQWLEQEERSWRQVVDVMIEVGRGLRAAHAIGLVHRDVKPDNILVGSDGRARIADFGLVRAVDDPLPDTDLSSSSRRNVGSVDATQHAPEPESKSKSESGNLGQSSQGARSGSQLAWGTPLLTQAGRAIGTPAYMAPEQHRGYEVDARTDQFGLCASLYEALYGIRPFDGGDVKSIRKQAISGEIRPPPANSGVPRWIERALIRGLAPAPEDRWPSLDSLLDALRRNPSRQWWWIGAITLGLVLLAGASYALASHRAELANRCTGASTQLAEVWGETPKNALATAFKATHDPLATATLPRIERLLDTYSRDWIDRHTQSCEAHQRGETSPMLLDRTMACLRQRKSELAALVEVLVEAEAGTIENAVLATHNLPNLAACTDSEALLAALPLPDDADAQREVEALRSDLGRALALEGAGRYDEGLELVLALESRVKSVNYLPLSAEYWLREGSLHMWREDFTTAAPILQKAFATGVEAKIDRVAIEAIAKWIFAIGYGLQRISEIEAMQIIGLSLTKRIEHGEELQALLLNNYASAKSNSNDREVTTALYREAISLWQKSADEENPQIAFARFNIANNNADFLLCNEAEENLQRALREASRSLSNDHPITQYMTLFRCAIPACRGDREEARKCYQERMDFLSQDPSTDLSALGEHFLLAAELILDSGDLEAARADLLHLESLLHSGDSIHRAYLQKDIGWIDLAEADLMAAANHFAKSAAIHERLGSSPTLRINTQAGLAEIELAEGKLGPARDQLATDLETLDAEFSSRPWLSARARFTLARTFAVSDAPESRDQAQKLATQALQSLERDRTQDGLRAEITTWIEDFDSLPAPTPAPCDGTRNSPDLPPNDPLPRAQPRQLSKTTTASPDQ